MSGGVLKHGDLPLKRDCVEHILSPRAPMALIIGASCRSQSGLSEYAWIHMSISRQNSGMPGGVLNHGDLTLKRDCVEDILSPRVPMALIIGASCISLSGRSEYMWVHIPISRQNSGMSGGVLQHGDLTLTRDCVEYILSPRAPMALTVGASVRSQSGLSEHVWVHMSISRNKKKCIDTHIYMRTYGSN